MNVKFKDGSEKEYIDLRYANLRYANLRRANLCGANLYDADLSGGADLRYANLCGADLRDANMRDADLRGADLCGADLCGADLRRANLRDANLRGADLDYSCWPLWCGSMSPKIDKRIACQLLYHAMMAMRGCDDSEVKEFLANKQAIALANQCHRADECRKILGKEVI